MFNYYQFLITIFRDEAKLLAAHQSKSILVVIQHSTIRMNCEHYIAKEPNLNSLRLCCFFSKFLLLTNAISWFADQQNEKAKNILK